MDGLLTFGEVRQLLSRVERISILSDDSSYENYPSIRDVPHGTIDLRPVKGIGRATVEFDRDADRRYPLGSLGDIPGGRFLADAMEFWLGDSSERLTVSGRLDALHRGLSSMCREAWALCDEVGGDAGEKLEWCAGDLGNVLDMLDDVAKLLSERGDTE